MSRPGQAGHQPARLGRKRVGLAGGGRGPRCGVGRWPGRRKVGPKPNARLVARLGKGTIGGRASSAQLGFRAGAIPVRPGPKRSGAALPHRPAWPGSLGSARRGSPAAQLRHTRPLATERGAGGGAALCGVSRPSRGLCPARPAKLCGHLARPARLSADRPGPADSRAVGVSKTGSPGQAVRPAGPETVGVSRPGSAGQVRGTWFNAQRSSRGGTRKGHHRRPGKLGATRLLGRCHPGREGLLCAPAAQLGSLAGLSPVSRARQGGEGERRRSVSGRAGQSGTAITRTLCFRRGAGARLENRSESSDG